MLVRFQTGHPLPYPGPSLLLSGHDEAPQRSGRGLVKAPRRSRLIRLAVVRLEEQGHAATLARPPSLWSARRLVKQQQELASQSEPPMKTSLQAMAKPRRINCPAPVSASVVCRPAVPAAATAAAASVVRGSRHETDTYMFGRLLHGCPAGS